MACVCSTIACVHVFALCWMRRWPACVHANVHAFTGCTICGHACVHACMHVCVRLHHHPLLPIHALTHSRVYSKGSGKTYTTRSMVEQASIALFEHIRSQPGREFDLRLSALEIYNEEVFDLLAGELGTGGNLGGSLRVLDDTAGQQYVEVRRLPILEAWSASPLKRSYT
eukprot:136451-Chlamydomonas_euryale.AAC.2